jgi:hypothetical protein
VRLLDDPNLSAVQANLVAEIYALQRTEGCFASNAHLGSIAKVGDRMLRRHISELESAGYLRSENRSSFRRRLWVSDELKAEIEAETHGDPCFSAGYRSSVELDAIADRPVGSTASSRKRSSGSPGNLNRNPVAEDREARPWNATENTSRKQVEKTKQNTGDIGFELPDWMPASLWQRWIAHNLESGRRLGVEQMKAQIAELQRLNGFGHPFKMVIEHSIQNNWKSFHELPSSKKPSEQRSLSGKRIINGRVVL